MVVLLDEQFLVHSAVHRAVLRLTPEIVLERYPRTMDGRNKVMGAAKDAVRSQPSEYEEDRECFQNFRQLLTYIVIVVNLLCILCSRIRTYRELLRYSFMINMVPVGTIIFC